MFADRISVNTKLYYLLTHADGELHEKEREMGEKMLWHESMGRERFQQDIDHLASQDSELIFKECMTELKTFHVNDQVNCVAWMCLIANADGFMDKNEWNLIYRIYQKELKLNLADITLRQKELHRFIRQYRNIPESSASLKHTQQSETGEEPAKPRTDTDTQRPRLAFPM